MRFGNQYKTFIVSGPVNDPMHDDGPGYYCIKYKIVLDYKITISQPGQFFIVGYFLY